MNSTLFKEVPMPYAAATFDQFLDETYPRLVKGLSQTPGEFVVDPDLAEHLIDVFQVPLLNSAVTLLEDGQDNYQEYEDNRSPKAGIFKTTAYRGQILKPTDIVTHNRRSELRIGQSISDRDERIEFYSDRSLDEAGDTPPRIEDIYYARDAQAGPKGKFIDDLGLKIVRKQLEVKRGQLALGREQTKTLSLRGRFPRQRIEVTASFTQHPTGEIQHGANEPELTVIVGQRRGVRRSLEPILPLPRVIR